MQKNKLIAFLDACTNLLYRADNFVLRMVRRGFAEPLMLKAKISKLAIMTIAFALAINLALTQDALAGTHHMMLMFSLNIILMFAQKISADITFGHYLEDFPDLTTDIPKNAAHIRLYTGTVYLISAGLYLLQGEWIGLFGFLAFILMQYAAACVPDELTAT